VARFLYTLLFTLLLPVVFFNLYRRGRKSPAYRKRWLERIGLSVPKMMRNSIWVHAVSVGEVNAAESLIRQLQRSFPDASIVVTTMTPTGSDRVKALFADDVYHQYLPYDIPWALARFIGRIGPQVCVVMETELWPNLIHQCHRRNIPVVVSNARLSASSAKGYGRVRALSSRMLAEIDRVLVQTEIEGQRFIDLGLPKDRLLVTGSIKFDIAIEPRIRADAETLRQQWSHRPCLIAASTHDGEDALILDAFESIRRVESSALLILVPRHPERFESVASLLQARDCGYVRRSTGAVVSDQHQVLLGDTMGELLVLMAAADIVFMGGSLVATGGHNVLEPIALGVPTITGPHTFNFQAITEMLLQRKGLAVAGSAKDLASLCLSFFTDPELARDQASRGMDVLNENKGALNRQLNEIKALMDR